MGIPLLFYFVFHWWMKERGGASFHVTFVKCLFQLFARFFKKGSFFLLTCKSSLYVMEMGSLSVICIKHLFMWFVFWWSEILNFNESQFITFFSYLVNAYCALRNLSLPQDHKDVLMLSSINFVVLTFTSRSTIYLEMNGVNWRVKIHFIFIDIQLS